eukprot:Platyproteum_vivax@DN6847_c0_g2_i1.p1
MYPDPNITVINASAPAPNFNGPQVINVAHPDQNIQVITVTQQPQPGQMQPPMGQPLPGQEFQAQPDASPNKDAVYYAVQPPIVNNYVAPVPYCGCKTTVVTVLLCFCIGPFALLIPCCCPFDIKT